MHDATDRDNARDAQVFDVTGYNLTTKEAEQLFSDSGVPRSARTIQRYCKSGYLDCKDYPTENGMMLRINQSSVERRIEEIQQVQATTDGRDVSRHVASADDTTPPVAPTTQAHDTPPVSRQTATDDDTKTRRDVSPQAEHRDDSDDTQRQAATAATGRDTASGGNEETVAALREQLEVKDETIRALREEREGLRAERQEDLEFYGNLRSFLRVQVQEVYDERNRLRERVKELEGLLPPGAESERELPAGQPSPLDLNTETEPETPTPDQSDAAPRDDAEHWSDTHNAAQS